MASATLRSALRRDSSPSLDFARVLEDEERQISAPEEPPALTGSADARLTAVIARRHAISRTALCLSGGGIRSASFAIGVMQGLAGLGVLGDIDYLSTVSGGGYAGSWLSAWLLHNGNQAEPHDGGGSVEEQLAGAGRDPLRSEPEPLRYVREFSRYLDPKIGLLSIDIWTLVATVCRNLLANWLVLLPLLAAALTMPRIYYALLDLGAQNNPLLPAERLDSITWLLIAGTTACGLMAMRYVVCNLPSTSRGCGSQKQFIVGCLGPIVTAAGFLTLYWGWNHELTGTPTSTAALFIGIIVAHIGVWLIWGRKTGRRLRTWLGAAIASIVTAGCLWLIEQRIFPDPLEMATLYTATAIPLVLLSIGFAGALFVAIAAGEVEDDDYEWWARAGAWLLVVAVVWLAAGSVVFFGPLAVHAVAQQLTRFHLSLTQAKALFGAATASSGAVAARAIGPSAGKEPSLVRRIVFALTAPTFAACALILLSWADFSVLARLQTISVEMYPHPVGAGLEEIGLLLVALCVTGLSMSFLVNVNKFSLHGMYRTRLIRTFLGASRSKAERRPNPFTGFDPADNVDMADLRGIQRPLQVLNVTLNLVSTNRLAWQDRRAESFTISPLHCGSRDVGYRPSDEYGMRISLGTAMTLSGAAMCPNEGAQSSPALTFLLTLFNARLGAWLGNPGPAGANTWRLRDPILGPVPLLSEMFGRTTDTNPYVYLSDGGHFENLGLYEMVLRRCHYIIVSDADCDPAYSFEDLGNAIRKIRIDLGIPITFNPGPRMTRDGQSRTNLHCAVATIDYRAVDGGDAKQGFLLYVKATLSGDEPMDVGNYGRASAGFPHESTSDQWFSEAQFESYRALGLHSIDVIAHKVTTLEKAPPTIRDLYLAARSYVGVSGQPVPEVNADAI